MGAFRGVDDPGPSKGERADVAGYEAAPAGATRADASAAAGAGTGWRGAPPADSGGRPAGWGKTSLLADWHATGHRDRVGWLALDPEDNDPVRFWSYLIAAVRTALPDVGGSALATLGMRGGPLLDTALPALLNDLATTGEDLHLVLDDYHVVTEPDLHRSVAYLLAHQPPCLHLVLATRSEPPLPFGRLRAHGELLEIRAADLAFTDTEATRAAAWFRAAGNVGEAISQAAAAGDVSDAVELVAAH